MPGNTVWLPEGATMRVIGNRRGSRFEESNRDYVIDPVFEAASDGYYVISYDDDRMTATIVRLSDV